MHRFRRFRVCLALSLLQVTVSAVAQETTFSDSAILESSPDTSLEPVKVFDCCECQARCFAPGFFVGLGGSYNSVRVDSVVSGSGVTDIYSGSQLVAIGFAGGPAAPIRETDTTFAPVVQAGYFQHLGNSEFLWGTKFSYKYLGLTISQDGFDAPQVGVYEVLDPPSTNTLTGNATTDSAQTIVDHELAFLPFLGHAYEHGRIYIGGGPVVFDTQAKLYGLSSYADINGQHTNVGGQPLNLSGAKWLWGGACQIGLVHYLRPSCFLDVNYDFMVTGINRFDWFVPVTSESDGLTYDTGIHYREELRLWAQSLNVTLNFVY
jgi:hypothetical protein